MLVISTRCHLDDDGGDAAGDKKHKEDYHLPFPQQTPQLSCLSLLLSGIEKITIIIKEGNSDDIEDIDQIFLLQPAL